MMRNGGSGTRTSDPPPTPPSEQKPVNNSGDNLSTPSHVRLPVIVRPPPRPCAAPTPVGGFGLVVQRSAHRWRVEQLHR